MIPIFVAILLVAGIVLIGILIFKALKSTPNQTATRTNTYYQSNANNAYNSIEFCSKCGTQFPNNAMFCSKCGNARSVQQPNTNPVYYNAGDENSIGYAILGFFVPIVGLILYLVWKDQYPLRAKSAGKGALVSAIVYAVFVVILIVWWLITLFGLFSLGGYLS